MVDQKWRQFSLAQPIPDPVEDRQEWDRLHKLRWEKNLRESWITRHAVYLAVWDNQFNMVFPRPEGIPLTEYLAWYSRLTVTLI